MKNFRLITLFILLTCFMALVGCMSSDDGANGGACGTVVDSSGKALSGVTVTAGGDSAVSDYFGNWSITSLKPQVYDFVATKENYITQTKTYEVPSGTTLDNIKFIMPTAGEIYDIVVSSVTSTNAKISFSTKYEAETRIEYGSNSLMNNEIKSSSANKFSHSFELTNLTPGTTYIFRCLGTDKYKRTLTSEIKTFTTEIATRGEPPTGLKISKVSGNSAFSLVWNADGSADFAGFNVYRASSLYGVFTKINTGAVMQSAFTDMGVKAGNKYCYRVTRLSGSGDETSPSAVVSMVMPGTITENVVWNIEGSPYELTGDLVIAHGGSLLIDKGVDVRVARGDQWDIDSSVYTDPISIDVFGTLMIQGTVGEPVSITSSENVPESGNWEGIVFKNSADLKASSIKGANIQFARNGISGENGLPTVVDSFIRNCSEAGIVGASSSVDINISGVEILNCTVGISISDCEKVTISNNSLKSCMYAIRSIGNALSSINDNKIKSNALTSIEVNNSNAASTVFRNTIGWGSSGNGIVCAGNDEIRRNTVQANICIEVKESAVAYIRSNLMLADCSRNGMGLLYSSESTSSPRLSIQNNGVWNQVISARKYANRNGEALSTSGDIAFSSTSGPALQGGDPFTDSFTDMNFSYVPSAGSCLKGAGFDSYEDVGAEDVPN